jgi:hypothetical protein
MNIATHTVVVPFPQAFPDSSEPAVPECPSVQEKQWRDPSLRRESHHQAVRRECALLRDSTLALSPSGKHVHVFTRGTSPRNPGNMIQLSMCCTEYSTCVQRKEGLFIPRMNDGGFQAQSL